jgi:hypothetical protein
MVCKFLANRLQSVALEVVHENQYGFIKGKTIQDCLGWAFEFLHQCHQSRRKIIILKLDFEKALDLIEHSAIFDMLHAKGFPPKWIRWVDDLLSTATSSMLWKELLGRNSSVREGLGKGILSPLSILQLLLICSSVS